jgi:predicted RNase H-like HicB family nuclease
MQTAHYEILQDSGEFYGTIPLCRGVYATASTLEACRDELRSVLEEWIRIRLRHRQSLPKIDDIDLSVHLDPAA